MWYELWDSETGNRVGSYRSEEAALRAVLDDVRRYGRDAVEVISLGLLRCDPEHRRDALIAEGPTLVERALAHAGIAPERSSHPTP